jgi:hypothetical protein
MARPSTIQQGVPSDGQTVVQVVQTNDSRGAFPHGLHLLLSILTLGAWIPIWIVHRLVSSR